VALLSYSLKHQKSSGIASYRLYTVRKVEIPGFPLVTGQVSRTVLGILLELSTSVGPVVRVLLVRRSSWMTMKLVRTCMHRRTTAFSLFSQHSGCEPNGCREYPRVGSGVELNTARYQCVIPLRPSSISYTQR
jgi:hypothetical protein